MGQDKLRGWLNLPDGPWPPDHYALIGLKRGDGTAEQIEVRVLERLERLRRYQLPHPDEATEGMNLLARALDTLTDPEARRAYDNTLGVKAAAIVEPPPLPQDDIINSLFASVPLEPTETRRIGPYPYQILPDSILLPDVEDEPDVDDDPEFIEGSASELAIRLPIPAAMARLEERAPLPPCDRVQSLCRHARAQRRFARAPLRAEPARLRDERGDDERLPGSPGVAFAGCRRSLIRATDVEEQVVPFRTLQRAARNGRPARGPPARWEDACARAHTPRTSAVAPAQQQKWRRRNVARRRPRWTASSLPRTARVTVPSNATRPLASPANISLNSAATAALMPKLASAGTTASRGAASTSTGLPRIVESVAALSREL